MYIYNYTYIYIFTYTYIYIYTYIFTKWLAAVSSNVDPWSQPIVRNPVQIPKRFECPDPKISQSNEVPDQVVQQVRPLTFLWLHNEDPSHRGYPEPPLGLSGDI